jgi:hypothetical protein
MPSQLILLQYMTSDYTKIEVLREPSFEGIKSERPPKEFSNHLHGVFGAARLENGPPVATTHLLIQQAPRTSFEGFEELITDGLGIHITVILFAHVSVCYKTLSLSWN